MLPFTSLFYITYICQNKFDNECFLLAKHEAVRPTKYLARQRNGSKNGVPSFDYLRFVADDNDNIALVVFPLSVEVPTSLTFLDYCPSNKITKYIPK